MKTIIAGSRKITDYNLVCQVIADSNIEITEVVSGNAQGVDMLGEKWARKNEVPVTTFPAQWSQVEGKPEHLVKRNKLGRKYYVLAGLERNTEMAEYADALILVWDGKSKGSKDMFVKANKAPNIKKIHVYINEK